MPQSSEVRKISPVCPVVTKMIRVCEKLDPNYLFKFIHKTNFFLVEIGEIGVFMVSMEL